MPRVANWDASLATYLEEVRSTPFEWGRFDCCHFAAGAVLAMTGEDRMAEFRGRYSTRIGSMRALKRIGAGDLPSTLSTKFREIPPSLAQRGDLVLSDDGQGGAGLGVALASFALMVAAEGQAPGLLIAQRAEWRRAWRVE